MISASLLGGRCRSNLSPETTVPSLDPACCEPNSTASLQEGEVPERGELGERARAREERERKGERNVREVGKKVTLQRVGALQGTYVGTRPAESTVTASASSSSAARRRSEPTDRMPSTPSARPPLLLERAFYIREIDTLRRQPGQGVFAAQVAHRSQKAHLPSATAPNHTRDTLPAVKRHTHQGKRNGRRNSAKTPGRKGAFSFSVSG